MLRVLFVERRSATRSYESEAELFMAMVSGLYHAGFSFNLALDASLLPRVSKEDIANSLVL